MGRLNVLELYPGQVGVVTFEGCRLVTSILYLLITPTELSE